MITGLAIVALSIVLLILLLAVVPPAADCWIPPNAPIRGMYAECWQAFELWS